MNVINYMPKSKDLLAEIYLFEVKNEVNIEILASFTSFS